MDVHAAFQVNDAKDANVKIYDYYQPDHAKSVSYNLPKTKGIKYWIYIFNCETKTFQINNYFFSIWSF